jgi:hypothetical protein
MTIPKKHLDFAKDNLARIAAAENDAENGYEAEDGMEMGEHNILGGEKHGRLVDLVFNRLNKLVTFHCGIRLGCAIQNHKTLTYGMHTLNFIMT